ncbi:TlpA disulfide reductase family protein [Clostridium sp. MD294]|uniref:TlpA family protein disulfide reductase n=1 Tax=Clostridium sp. MD294 TaxID=97138 RepID=UPI0002CBDFDB|nr:TlpA disulfide reductase family protein [Clostridium sp. MD294]NDO46773.1 TlpA family protein disulfide reductase [Clostridium sp. MD294]USF28785.1 hypothetical protein C820_000159 [Clostridium sp. MD294]
MKQLLNKIIIFCILIGGVIGCSTTQQTQPQVSKTQEKTENYKLSAFSMPIQTEYVYDYLGMRFQLGEEVNKALEEGKLFMYLDAGYEQNTQELAYARQAVLYVPKEDREKIWENDAQQIKNWREQAQKLGYIGVYKRSVLEQTDISELTNCTENKNIGETPDGTWQYYISSNNIAEVHIAAERFSRTLVTIYDMVPFTQGVSIFAEQRKIEQNMGNFQTTDIYGNTVTKDIFANYDLTLVSVFTTQSTPCLHEMVELEKVFTDEIVKTQSVNVIGILYDASEQKKEEVIELAKTIQEELNITYNIIVPDSVLMEGRLKGVTAFPETFFVDRQGNIIGEYYLGARPKENLIEIIQKELEFLRGENSGASEEQATTGAN